MNIISKLAITTTAAVLLLLTVNGDEKKMAMGTPNGTPKGTSLAATSAGESKAEPSQAKADSNTTASKPGAPKSKTPKVVVAKTSALAVSSKKGASKSIAPEKTTKTAKTATATTKSFAELTPSQLDKVLALLNQGSKEELAAIKGVAGTRLESIVSARPFKTVDDLILVPGVGDVTVDRIIEHGIKPGQSSTKSVKS